MARHKFAIAIALAPRVDTDNKYHNHKAAIQSYTIIPWMKLSRMARIFTRKAQKCERELSLYLDGAADSDKKSVQAEDALVDYAMCFANELKKYGLKIGSH